MYDLTKWNEIRKSVEAEIKSLKKLIRKEARPLEYFWADGMNYGMKKVLQAHGTYQEYQKLAGLKAEASYLYCARKAMKKAEGHEHGHGLESCYPEVYLAEVKPGSDLVGNLGVPEEGQEAQNQG